MNASLPSGLKQTFLDPLAASLLPPANPAKELRDLRLSRSLTWQKLLEPLLNELRFEIEEPATRKSHGSRQYTLIKRERVQRTLIYVPKWILNNPDDVNIEVMKAVATAFEEGAKLLIFSEEDVLGLPMMYIQMLRDVWERRCRVTAQFVPYKELENADQDRQILLLKGLLDLEESPPVEDPILREKERRLEQLHIRQAREGRTTPPEVLTEIQDLEWEIEKLKKRN